VSEFSGNLLSESFSAFHMFSRLSTMKYHEMSSQIAAGSERLAAY
jgi:hypothetical protein